MSCLLAGGFYESTYSVLAGLVWLGLAASRLTAPTPAAWILVALAGWTAASALWGPAGPALRAAPLAALYAGVLVAAENVDRHVLLRLACGVCVGVAIVALGAAAFGLAPEAPGPESSRLAWPIGYANGLGLVMAFGLLLSFRLQRRAGLAAGAICATALALTFSRTAILAALVGLVVLAALRGRIPRSVALGGGVVLAVTAGLLAQPFAARFAAPAPDERDARRLIDVSGHGRSELWRSAWEQGLDAPVVGNGAGTWARGYLDDLGSVAAPANAHSLLLETFAELGLVGVGLLGAFLVLVLRRGRREPVAAAAVAAWAIHSNVDWTWQLPAATLPMVFAAAALTRDTGTQSPSPAAEPSRGTRACVTGTQTLVLSLASLAVGAACAAHGVGAALLESGRPRPAAPLLPWDARPPVARGDLATACRLDAAEPAILRVDPAGAGCARS